MNAKPRVSLGLPVYNGANYLAPTMDTLLGQDMEDLELIISDNASTDATEDICREYAAKDKRVHYHRFQENQGAARNYNKVFELAQAPYFKWAAHDDECYPSMVRRCVEVLEEAPKSVTLVYTLAELIDEEGSRVRAPLDRIDSRESQPAKRLSRILSKLTMCDPIFGVYRREYLERSQLIGSFCGADRVLLGEMAMMGEIWEIDEVLFRLREHKGRSMTANKNKRARTSWYDPKAGKKRFLLPVTEQMVWEMTKSARRMDLSFADKTSCLMTIPRVHYWRRMRNAGGRQKQRIMELFRQPTKAS